MNVYHFSGKISHFSGMLDAHTIAKQSPVGTKKSVQAQILVTPTGFEPMIPP